MWQELNRRNAIVYMHPLAVIRRALQLMSMPTTFWDDSTLESTNAALPILREQADRIRALTPPVALQLQIERFFELTDRSLDTLESVRDDARHLDSNHVGVDLIQFAKESAAAKRVGHTIGYRC